jgi:hypothetical protein
VVITVKFFWRATRAVAVISEFKNVAWINIGVTYTEFPSWPQETIEAESSSHRMCRQLPESSARPRKFASTRLLQLPLSTAFTVFILLAYWHFLQVGLARYPT